MSHNNKICTSKLNYVIRWEYNLASLHASLRENKINKLSSLYIYIYSLLIVSCYHKLAIALALVVVVVVVMELKLVRVWHKNWWFSP